MNLKIILTDENENIFKENVSKSLYRIKQVFNKLEEGHIWLNKPTVFASNNPDLEPSKFYLGK